MIVTKEEWKDIDFNKNYKISDRGKVINKKTNKTLKKGLASNGYYTVSLPINNKMRSFTIHELVAKHFVKGREKNLVINHKDGDKTNNYYRNLEWCTRQENVIHAFVNKLCKPKPRKLSKDDVLTIRSMWLLKKEIEKIQKTPLTKSFIAILFDVSQATIYEIINKKTWEFKYEK